MDYGTGGNGGGESRSTGGFDNFANIWQEDEDVTSLPIDQVLQRIKVAIHAVNNDSDVKLLKRSFRQLSIKQYDIVFDELIKDVEFHEILKKIDRSKMEKIANKQRKKLQRMIFEMATSLKLNAIVARGVVTTTINIFGAIIEAAVNQTTQIDSFAEFCTVAFALFSGIELMRFLRHELAGKELVKNIGEHSSGCVASFGGTMLGVYACTKVGGSLGPMGRFFGSVLSCIFPGTICNVAGRLLFRKLFPPTTRVFLEKTNILEIQIRQQAMAKTAAEKLKINFEKHSFKEAQQRFRQILLSNHPDKYPDASLDRKAELTAETTEILRYWEIVKEYYKTLGKYDETAESGSYIELYVFKVLNTINGHWKTVRTFFADRNFDGQAKGIEGQTNERVEVVKVYN